MNEIPQSTACQPFSASSYQDISPSESGVCPSPNPPTSCNSTMHSENLGRRSLEAFIPKLGAGKVAQQGRALVAKPDGLISIPRTPHDGRKKPSPGSSLLMQYTHLKCLHIIHLQIPALMPHIYTDVKTGLLPTMKWSAVFHPYF